MKKVHVISYLILMGLLALSGLSAGCASGKDPQQNPGQNLPSPVGPVNIARANTALKGPATPVSDHMWRTYAARGQAFAECGAPVPASSGGRSAGTSARKTVRKAKKAAPAPKKPVTAELICPDGCVPAPKAGQRGTPPSLGSAAQASPAPAASGSSAALSGPASSVQTQSPVGVTTSTAVPTPSSSQAPGASSASAAAPALQPAPPAPPAPAVPSGRNAAPVTTPPASAAQQAPAPAVDNPLQSPAAQSPDSGARPNADAMTTPAAIAPPVPSGASLGSLGNSAWQTQGSPPSPAGQ